MEKRKFFKVLYFLLAITLTAVIFIWDITTTGYFDDRNVLLIPFKSGSTKFLLEAFFINLPLMIVVGVTAIIFKREFPEKTDMVMPNRYHFTLVLTVIYTFLLPLFCELTEHPRSGALSWFYFLFFIAFLEEFYFLILIPYILTNKAGINSKVEIFISAILYALFSSLIVFTFYPDSSASILFSLLTSLIGFFFYFFMRGCRKWTGALWLPTIAHALFSSLGFLITSLFL